MKKTKWIASLVCTAILANSSIMAVQAGQSSAVLAATAASSQISVVENEIKTYKSAVDKGLMTAAQAGQAAAQSLVEKNVSMADIELFVELNNTKKEAKKFKKSVKDVLAGVEDESDSSFESLSDEEKIQVLGLALQAAPQGPSWSGCTGATVGVITMVAAVVVGIIALTKSKSDERIKKGFANDRRNREQRYNDDRANVANRPANITIQIERNNTQISENEATMAYNTGIITASVFSNDPELKAKAQAAVDENKRLLQDNVDLRGRNDQLAIEYHNYMNPAFVAAQYSQIETDYQADMRGINDAEQHKLANAPADRALAKKLGIGAGVGAAIGLYFTIDGFSDCN